MSSDEPLIDRFYLHANDEIDRRPGEVRAAIAEGVRTLAATREPGHAAVQVVNPTVAEDGWSSRNTVIRVVTDDMPFVVDSMLGQLTQRNLTMHLLLHPQLRVHHGDGGIEILDAVADGGVLESWMHLEIDRIPEEADRLELRDHLERVLGDVRAAFEDWSAMRRRCLDIVAELRDHVPPSVDPDTVEPTIRFLSWLENNHFTFLGYREYTLEWQDGEEVLRAVPDTGLGLLRPREHSEQPETGRVTRLRPEARETATDPRLLTITKANSRSTVHRPVYLDYIGVRQFDRNGTVIGERRFLGLFTSSAYNDSVTRLPIIGTKVSQVLQRSGYAPGSHSGKDLMSVLENYPRDELFQADIDTLAANAGEVLFLQERRGTRLFIRKDEFGRFISALVYLPRDRFNTAVRLRIETLLRRAYGAVSADYTTRVGESALAQIHYVLRLPREGSIPEVDVETLEADLLAASRTWDEQVLEGLQREYADDDVTGDVWARYVAGFPEAYKEDFDPGIALGDIRLVRSLETRTSKGMPLQVYDPADDDPATRRLKIYRDSDITLTQVLPVFTHMGVEVTQQRPYEITGRDGKTRYIYDFGMLVDDPEVWEGHDAADTERRRTEFEDAFAAVWSGEAESDSLNALVLTADLYWRQVVILRTVVRYLRQVGTFSLDYLEEALVANPHIARLVVDFFAARFDPDVSGDRTEIAAAKRAEIFTSLDAVASLDQDRIIRAVVNVIEGTLRTNFYKIDENGQPKPHVSLKLSPRAIEGLPEPRPAFEIWVYAPRVEGVHLRFGAVARGGLRWSDRREDFRTEVLGLVKAQMVKNAVIVPTGSKGGFVAKRLPDPSVDREAWLNEGIGCYRIFIKGMLDLTDNRVEGEIVPPDRVVRHDDDDPYLVVAADKGTATFSDIANGVSADYGFWLDDAFASGGSAGYDHKEMGITARGAWESVKRHFRELGLDTQTDDFTVVGVGDMSGDVFGNGMLLSEHIRLLAAFDHRHVFLDPNPDAAASFAERQRLFELPRSSWEDYDPALISEGGGVQPRTAKSIPITPKVREALGLDDGVSAMAPAELLSGILKAPADLLWNGGIGTYVKASTETDAEIGDRGNDAIRVNGAHLRVRVVGEGGNLGFSQLGRIEAAKKGVHVNTDAIDNSGGVDSSDQEVNIKIALKPLLEDGTLGREARNELLASMTDEVAHKVLRHNYEQNLLIGNARYQHGGMTRVHQRLMHTLAEQVDLDRELEFLPSDADLGRRQSRGEGLTSPEFSVLVAYSKMAIKDALLTSDLPDDEFFNDTLRSYFPDALTELVGERLSEHPLRRQIIANELANQMVNRGGITFAFRAAEETGATIPQITRAFAVCREVFRLGDYVAAVEELDNVVSTDSQAELYLEFRRLLDRGVRWFLNNQALTGGMATEIERFAGPVQELTAQVGQLLQGGERGRWRTQADAIRSAGVPPELASWHASLLDSFSLLDVVELAEDCDTEIAEVAGLYFATSELFRVDLLLNRVAELPRDDRWSSLARGAVRDDLYGVLRALTRTVLMSTDRSVAPKDRVDQWAVSNRESLVRVSQVLGTIGELENPGLAPLSVALRTLRGLVRQGTAG